MSAVILILWEADAKLKDKVINQNMFWSSSPNRQMLDFILEIGLTKFRDYVVNPVYKIK